MAQALNVPDRLYGKLARSAAQRGLSLVSLLEHVVRCLSSSSGIAADEARTGEIERLLEKQRGGGLTEREREKLERLIDEDFRRAGELADRGIVRKLSRREPAAPGQPSPRLAWRSRGNRSLRHRG